MLINGWINLYVTGLVIAYGGIVKLCCSQKRGRVDLDSAAFRNGIPCTGNTLRRNYEVEVYYNINLYCERASLFHETYFRIAPY